jgi:SAM-dependent methyltransferase
VTFPSLSGISSTHAADAHDDDARDAYDESLPLADRKRLGAWYTPLSLVEHVVSQTVGSIDDGDVVRVLDPACGDGRFLHAAARWIRAQGGVPVLTGVDIDGTALRIADRLDRSIELIEADALTHDWGERTFDVVVGNPPFLSQLSTATVRAGGSRFGGGPYADGAADFLALSVQLTRSESGRVGLVLPLSLLTARDAGPIRASVTERAELTWFWWSEVPMFEAMVRTCAIGIRRSAALPTTRRIDRTVGSDYRRTTSISCPADATSNNHWGWMLADELGVPALPDLRTMGTLGDHALVTANFRDQYYGLVGAVSDGVDGPPLVTTGLIDPAVCHWGRRPTRFAKEVFEAPRVDRSKLVTFMLRWADRCLAPKVLVATQTKVLEAVVDEHGHWLPAVPVIRLMPNWPHDLWRTAAVLTSPIASALIAAESIGSGLSPRTVRVSQRTLSALPWPEGDLTAAVAALHAGDVVACGRAVDIAYGADDPDLLSWWSNGLTS